MGEFCQESKSNCETNFVGGIWCAGETEFTDSSGNVKLYKDHKQF